ncbi:hypothetical protein, partial [Neisseria weixii]
MFYVKGYSRKKEEVRTDGRSNFPPVHARGTGYQISPYFASLQVAEEFCRLCEGKADEIVPLAIVRE